MPRLVLAFAVAALVACSSETDSTPDASTDLPDAGVTADAGRVDAGSIADAGSIDAGRADAGSVDAGATDAGSDDPGGLVLSGDHGQCAGANHCGAGQTCVVSAPGGFCNGCEDDSDCGGPGDSRSYTCNFGGCNLDCDTDGDCPTGLRCSSGGSCLLLSCGTCPAPYVCEGGFCRRPPCDVNCPEGHCVAGRCVDDL